MKIKIIDLLNSYSRNETQPKLVRFGNNIFECNVNSVIWQIIERYKGNIIFLLNFEVEIIGEDKMIEKLGKIYDGFSDSYYDTCLVKIAQKVDEVIDALNKLKVDD